jgi:hypothetical protein
VERCGDPLELSNSRRPPRGGVSGEVAGPILRLVNAFKILLSKGRYGGNVRKPNPPFYQSLKSPVCWCVSITLPGVIVNANHATNVVGISRWPQSRSTRTARSSTVSPGRRWGPLRMMPAGHSGYELTTGSKILDGHTRKCALTRQR